MEIDGFYFLRNEIIEDFKNKKKIRKKLCLDLFKNEKTIKIFMLPPICKTSSNLRLRIP